jgi:uncharacterized membrane protein YfcA
MTEFTMALLWIMILFFLTLGIGILAPLGGIGGGVLFVPLASAFFPFNVDFIRGTGLLMALMSSLSSSPYLIERGLVNIKIIAPIAAVSIVTSTLGGIAGLWLTNTIPQGTNFFYISLGAVLLSIVVVMFTSKATDYPDLDNKKMPSQKLDLGGSWYEPRVNKIIEYKATHLAFGMLFFGFVGFIAGMFGLGAGWASVPVMNLIMGVPIKVSVATSMTLITINSAAAAWVFIAKGATLPFILVPSMLGISLGARIGAKLTTKAHPFFIRYLVIGIMIFAAALDVYKGLRGLDII